MGITKTLFAAAFLVISPATFAQKKTDTVAKAKSGDSLKNISLAGLNFRSIGPAVTGGRVVRRDAFIGPSSSDRRPFFTT